MKYELIEAETNGGTDFLLTKDGKVISRFAELTATIDCVEQLENWDNQAESGSDLSDYQSDLDSGNYDRVRLITSRVIS